jgi:hypothetical protein
LAGLARGLPLACGLVVALASPATSQSRIEYFSDSTPFGLSLGYRVHSNSWRDTRAGCAAACILRHEFRRIDFGLWYEWRNVASLFRRAGHLRAEALIGLLGAATMDRSFDRPPRKIADGGKTLGARADLVLPLLRRPSDDVPVPFLGVGMELVRLGADGKIAGVPTEDPWTEWVIGVPLVAGLESPGRLVSVQARWSGLGLGWTDFDRGSMRSHGAQKIWAVQVSYRLQRLAL